MALDDEYFALAADSAKLYKRSQEAALVMAAYEARIGWPHGNMPMYIPTPPYHVTKHSEVKAGGP